MKYHARASKQLIVLAALALAFAPAGKAVKSPSRFHLDGKTGSTERVSAPAVPADRNSGAQEAARQTPPPSATVAGQPTVKRPLVTYEDGELTIIAENTSLSEVMKALRTSLGADIDLPANVNDQQIWVHLGPGPARRVLRDLLDGTEFNYVIQASESDPDGIRSVLLTPRSKSTGPETAGPPERNAIRRMPGHESDAASATGSENPPSEPVASSEPSQEAAPAAQAATPAAAAASSVAAAASSAAPVNVSSASLQYTPGNSASAAVSPPPPTDPNQMIQTLQSMYEQRRQMQMQQNQKPAVQNQ